MKAFTVDRSGAVVHNEHFSLDPSIQRNQELLLLTGSPHLLVLLVQEINEIPIDLRGEPGLKELVGEEHGFCQDRESESRFATIFLQP